MLTSATLAAGALAVLAAVYVVLAPLVGPGTSAAAAPDPGEDAAGLVETLAVVLVGAMAILAMALVSGWAAG